MSIRLGSRIVAGGGSSIKEDGVTTLKDPITNEIQVAGSINKNESEHAESVVYDWVGSLDEYQTQNVAEEHPEWVCYITDDETEVITNGCSLLDFKWADHILNDIRWLRADTFNWQSAAIYSAAYQHLVNDLYEYNVDLYCWASSSTSKIVYTRTETPIIGDYTYDEYGHKWKIINSVSSGEIDVFGALPADQGPYIRNFSGDLNVNVTVAEQKTETISGITITCYVAQDGHKIVLPDQENNIVALYGATGVAWYYILDITNRQFKLPRTKFEITGLRDNVGDYVEPTLPNVTGFFDARGYPGNAYSGAIINSSGVMSYTKAGGVYEGASGISLANDATSDRVSFDASRSSSIYQNNATLQPSATQMYLYFYMGNFTQSAEQNAAGITSEELNKKIDITNFQIVNSLPANPVVNTFYFVIGQ